MSLLNCLQASRKSMPQVGTTNAVPSGTLGTTVQSNEETNANERRLLNLRTVLDDVLQMLDDEDFLNSYDEAGSASSSAAPSP